MLQHRWGTIHPLQTYLWPQATRGTRRATGWPGAPWASCRRRWSRPGRPRTPCAPPPPPTRAPGLTLFQYTMRTWSTTSAHLRRPRGSAWRGRTWTGGGTRSACPWAARACGAPWAPATPAGRPCWPWPEWTVLHSSMIGQMAPMMLQLRWRPSCRRPRHWGGRRRRARWTGWPRSPRWRSSRPRSGATSAPGASRGTWPASPARTRWPRGRPGRGRPPAWTRCTPRWPSATWRWTRSRPWSPWIRWGLPVRALMVMCSFMSLAMGKKA
mmetsp:Transcript_12373/g.20119  ORF Transcript_12373/g.20119 Transcript_12373/m.20119 type:complete len:269 (+) Transcript_12373:522-1328(+)